MASPLRPSSQKLVLSISFERHDGFCSNNLYHGALGNTHLTSLFTHFLDHWLERYSPKTQPTTHVVFGEYLSNQWSKKCVNRLVRCVLPRAPWYKLFEQNPSCRSNDIDKTNFWELGKGLAIVTSFLHPYCETNP